MKFSLGPVFLLVSFLTLLAPASASALEAGAAAVDVSPVKLPAIRNGGFLQEMLGRVDDPLFARALVLRSGAETVALCVVDSCMLPTDVCEAIKAEVTRQCGLPADRILISATHTHSAPSTMEMCLGTRKDEAYTAQMIPQTARAIVEAHAALRPAKVGWTAVDAPEFTHCRRWIRRSDRIAGDPFGQASVRAMMHPGYENPEFVGPAGPVDPQLSLLSVVSVEGDRTICVLANYSMHYFGAGAGFSADYFGDLARRLEGNLGGVGIVSQGTSGDLHWMDYSRPAREGFTRDQYAEGMAKIALEAIGTITYRADSELRMAESRLDLGRRLPSPERLAWAAPINKRRGDGVPTSQQEVYAEQARWIHENPRAELTLQALRIGDLGITAIPNEVYGITGLKLKAQSPLAATFNIELANGADGYIPPPEQHRLGGYTTWPARTAGLEEGAEPEIVETLLVLLEKVSGKARRPMIDDDTTAYSRAVLGDEPIGLWHLNDLDGPAPREATGKSTATFEAGVAYGLPGVQRAGGALSAIPDSPSAISGAAVNRAAHFAGGRMRTAQAGLGRRYTAEFWFWNGFPTEARAVTGYLFSRGVDGDKQALGEHLGIGGTYADAEPGKLFFYTGNDIGRVIRGRTPLAFRDWHHVAVVRDGERLTVYLDGRVEIEEAALPWTVADGADEIFLGGRCDGMFGFEGKIDEVALYNTPLSPEQVAAHFKASERVAPEVPRPKPASDPLSPEESLKAWHLPDGFEARLAAAEPLVLDPVAFDWDTRGRLWVVEMADYPLGLDGTGARGGRVRVLDDPDGDGVYDHATLFADGLNFPNGLLTWRDGVIVTAAPDILFLADRDGDGKAEHREILFTGLTEGNQQLRANGLRWGLDNWVYVAAGGHHGAYGTETTVHSTRTGRETVIGSRDFRLRPDTGEVEPESGPTQFGRNRDDWGHWFGTQNAHPLWLYVLPDRYLRRNPHLAAPDGRIYLPDAGNPPVFPASPPEKRFHSFNEAGHFTSACGGMIYQDRALFPDGGMRAFVCEPFHNLVQKLRLEPDGIGFSARREGGEGEPDFLASEDRWCRPVMARTGPDGALWIADMYRYMIEHPDWLPAEGKAELLPHYRLGDDRGRILRIVRKNGDERKIPSLESLDTGGLVALLESPNGWVRDKAQQVLLWRNDSACVAILARMADESGNPRARLHALCTLDGLGALTAEEIVRALGDPHPGVRENALRLAEGSDDPAVVAAVVALAGDPDPKVRLQLAFSLGEWPTPEAGRALLALLEREGGNAFVRTAVLSSAPPHLAAMAASANAETRPSLARMAMGDHAVLAVLLAPLLSPNAGSAQWAELGAILGELEANETALEGLADGTRENLRAVFENAAARLRSPESPLGERLTAAALLARQPGYRDTALENLAGLLGPALSGEATAAALRALAASGDARVPGIVLGAWPSLSPEARGFALDTLLTRPEWTAELVAGIGSGPLRAGDFDPARRMRLLNLADESLRAAAVSALGTSDSPARSKVVEAHRGALELPGTAPRGHAVFLRACASCHRLGDEGLAIGPDLRTVAAHPPEKLLANILDPNLDIQPGFHAYSATLRSGEQVFGMIASEDASSLRFRLPDATERPVLRRDIAALSGTGVSLMPEGLEATLTDQDLADLIAFLRQP